MLEEHQSSSPAEEIMKCSTSGDLGRVEELVRGGDVAIDNQYNGHTALQAASQVGPVPFHNGPTEFISGYPIRRMDTSTL